MHAANRVPLRAAALAVATSMLVAFAPACGSANDDGLGSGGNSDATGPSGGSGVATGAEGPIRQISAGRHHTCIRREDSSIYCWGQGAYRALGGDYNFQGTPRRVDAIPDAAHIASGARFGCAIRASGDVWCWGENDSAQVGDNATVPCGDCANLPACADSVCVPAPKPMAGLESAIVELSLGNAHGCGRRSDGSVVCWGSNAHGQAGQGDVSAVLSAPARVEGVSGATQIAAGQEFSCALVGQPGKVMCWGRNQNGQIGNGDSGDAPVTTPTAVRDLADAVEIAAGGTHACARRESGAVVCWGYNYLGALGNGSTRPTRSGTVQEVVGLTDAVEITAGQNFTCARRKGGTVSCWGHAAHGQLGDGTTGETCSGKEKCSTSPVEVKSVTGATTLATGDLHACAADAAGTMWCWGYNLGGELGLGTVSKDPTPTPVEVQGLP